MNIKEAIPERFSKEKFAVIVDWIDGNTANVFFD